MKFKASLQIHAPGMYLRMCTQLYKSSIHFAYQRGTQSPPSVKMLMNTPEIRKGKSKREERPAERTGGHKQLYLFPRKNEAKGLLLVYK